MGWVYLHWALPLFQKSHTNAVKILLWHLKSSTMNLRSKYTEHFFLDILVVRFRPRAISKSVPSLKPPDRENQLCFHSWNCTTAFYKRSVSDLRWLNGRNPVALQRAWGPYKSVIGEGTRTESVIETEVKWGRVRTPGQKKLQTPEECDERLRESHHSYITSQVMLVKHTLHYTTHYQDHFIVYISLKIILQ